MEDIHIDQAIDAFASFINNGKTMPSNLETVIFDWLKLSPSSASNNQTRKEDLLGRFDALFKEKLLALDLTGEYKRLPIIAPKQPPPLLGLVGGMWYLHALIHENKSTYEADAIQNNLNHASESLTQFVGIKATLPKAYQGLHASGKSLRRYAFKYAVPWLGEGQMPERKGRFKPKGSARVEEIAAMCNGLPDDPTAGESAKHDTPTPQPQQVANQQLHQWCIADNSQAIANLETVVSTESLQASLKLERGVIIGVAASGKTTLLRQYQEARLQESEVIVIYAKAWQYRDCLRNPHKMAVLAMLDAGDVRGLLPNDVTAEDIEATLAFCAFTLLVDDGNRLSDEELSILLRTLTRLPQNASWLIALSSTQKLPASIASWQAVMLTTPSLTETVTQIWHESEQPQRRQLTEHLLFRTAPILRQSRLAINFACQETLAASAGMRWRALGNWLNKLLTHVPDKTNPQIVIRSLSALAFNASSVSGDTNMPFKIESVKGILGQRLDIHLEPEAIDAAIHLSLLAPISLDGQTHFTHRDLHRFFAAQAWIQQVLFAWEAIRDQRHKVFAWTVAPTTPELDELLGERWQTVLVDAVALSISFLSGPFVPARDSFTSQCAKFWKMLHERLDATKPTLNVSRVSPKLPMLAFAMSHGLACEQREFSALKVLADQYPAVLMRLADSWRVVLDTSLRAQQLSAQDSYYSLRLMVEMNALSISASSEEAELDTARIKAIARRVIYDTACILVSEHAIRLHSDFPSNIAEASMYAYFLRYGCEALDQLLRLACKTSYVHRLAAVRCIVYGALLSPKPTLAVNYGSLLDEAFAYGTPEIQAEIVAFLLGNSICLRWETALGLVTSSASILVHHHDLLTEACRRYGAAMATVRAKQTLQKQGDGLSPRLKTALRTIAAASKPQSHKAFL